MPIVATAGHVDHGKTTLVRALTGTDPDRWAEEQRRGLTIDLGFAWADLGEGEEVGFIDVPGHERFVKNMLAGVGAVDVALLVVAADEGWMPQSEEHLAVLDLLEIHHGVVALTRADLVDDATLLWATADVEARLAGTSLEGVAVVPVAAPHRTGLDDLRARLSAALRAAGPAPDHGRPRMWIDRSFVIAGSGTVVTGTLTGGSIAVGDELAVFPNGIPVRVRGLHHHGGGVESAGPGSRTAVNVSGIERTAARGSMLGAPGRWPAGRRFVADLRTVRTLDAPVAGRGAFQVHAGSGSWPVRVQPLEGSEIDGRGAALFLADQAIPLVAGDRIVLREVGRRAVVAGGSVLDPAPTGNAAAVRASLELLRDAATGDADDRATALLEVRGSAGPDRLEMESGGGTARAAVRTPQAVLSAPEAARISGQIRDRVAAFHDANPSRPGIPTASLASTLAIDQGVVAEVVAADASIIDDGAVVRSAGFSAGWTPGQDAAWQRARRTLEAAGVAAPRAAELGLDRELFHALIRSERLVRVAPDLVYLPEQITLIRETLQTMEDGFTVAEFRDALGVTRRQAVPLLEWLDRAGDTRREGNGRIVRRRPSPGRTPDDAPPR